MSKTEIITHLIKRHEDFPPIYLKFFLETLLDLINNELASGSTIKIRKLGTFYTKTINNKFKGKLKKVKFQASPTLHVELNC